MRVRGWQYTSLQLLLVGHLTVVTTGYTRTLCSGLAGFYLLKNSTDVGVGPDRWGLDGMEEYHWILQDKVLDRQCQLRYEPEVGGLSDLTWCIPNKAA
jgi:hypothetical protein